ncbi:hypothetical protein ABZV64_04595 [Streptomyces sp. NPDC004959]|uniref:hypothetical protein n=1 Tax=Streptomyces sp. NPDC004959 TaxID=3154673 RepID=UPI0033A5E3B8
MPRRLAPPEDGVLPPRGDLAVATPRGERRETRSPWGARGHSAHRPLRDRAGSRRAAHG